VAGPPELSGALALVDARSDWRLDIPESPWTTLGGYVFSVTEVALALLSFGKRRPPGLG
jgi:hypothetical protein